MRLSFLERGQQAGLVIGAAIFPAAVQNAEPFEGQGPNGGVMRFLAVALLLVVLLCPEAFLHEMLGPIPERFGE
jgi:hypothetical protein